MSSDNQNNNNCSSGSDKYDNNDALIEIIHLHNCFRGAIRDLQRDVGELKRLYDVEFGDDNHKDNTDHSECRERTKDLSKVQQMEGSIAGRFKVIWSVFSAHSNAEDEFIWPALKKKLSNEHSVTNEKVGTTELSSTIEHHDHSHNHSIDQSEYEEDHADEEKMFKSIDDLLLRLNSRLKCFDYTYVTIGAVRQMIESLVTFTNSMAQHLTTHLAKEEDHCLPLVKKHLDVKEIHELVGNIMGKRSSQVMGQILSLAIQNLPIDERSKMIFHMKEAMLGTYFERWLDLGGWLRDFSQDQDQEPLNDEPTPKKQRIEEQNDSSMSSLDTIPNGDTISSEELEKLIRTIASNTSLSASEKNATIQKLRESVWNAKQRRKQSESSINNDQRFTLSRLVLPVHQQRSIPPSFYFKASSKGDVTMIWNSYDTNAIASSRDDIPLFSASEIAATYHDGGTSAVLGCPHYSRTCKLRHPTSGRLYTCRLCCDQAREQPTKENDSPLDRFAVSEVFCMRCGALQPATSKCLNSFCESQGRPFAKYYCSICHLYDDSSKKIYHCPFCNVCRLGLGLGIDFKHCMRCNACVAMNEEHTCIPSSLQGKCPVCYDTMFESTEPLRRLRCGHVMHLNCYNRMHLRGQILTCPLCKKSTDDMKDMFSLLDSAVRMQPMPPAYSTTKSNIYCQDCSESSCVQYHFVGLKCQLCGSYNTRELERLET